MPPDHDVIVCGGGPAGLAATLWLGRYRRKVLMIDEEKQRNLPAEQSHGYLTRDGASPGDLIRLAREEVDGYPTVTRSGGHVDRLQRKGQGFVATIDGKERTCQRLLLATGVEDVFPDLPGFSELYGKAIFHCPSCDGYEARDQDVVAIGWGEHVSGFTLDLMDWGAQVSLVTNGRPFEGDGACSVALRRNNIEVFESKITSFQVEDGAMKGVVLETGEELPAVLAFFYFEHEPRTDLAGSHGCALDEAGNGQIDGQGQTTVEGVFAAGDLTPGEQLIQVASAQGDRGIACAMSLRGDRSRGTRAGPGPGGGARGRQGLSRGLR